MQQETLRAKKPRRVWAAARRGEGFSAEGVRGWGGESGKNPPGELRALTSTMIDVKRPEGEDAQGRCQAMHFKETKGDHNKDNGSRRKWARFPPNSETHDV
jgi:hypothetical protein